jgi:hypothetical protein
VTDKSGAVVAGANVTITENATGVTRHTVTSGSGFYNINALSPGRYTVVVEAQSFGKSETKDVVVVAENVRGLNVTLGAAAAETTVDVSSEAAGLETESANTDATITSEQVQRIPTYQRNPYDLLRFAPGVFGDASLSANGQANWFPNASGPGGSDQPGIFQNENYIQATANGQRASSNNFMIDGTSVNSLTWGGAAILTPNEDSVQEIAVTSSTYSAEDGRNSGAQVKVVSKSGTNQFHGTGFFRYQEPGLNAYNQWNGANNTPTERVNLAGRDFGGSIGGPIIKNKLFFFFSYEGARINQTTYSSQWIETQQFDSMVQQMYPNTLIGQAVKLGGYPRVVSVIPQTNCLAAAGQGYSGCQVVNGMLDVGSPFGTTYGNYAPVFSAGSTGGGLDGIPDMEDAFTAMPSKSNGNQYNIRVDYNMSSKDLLAFSGYYTPRNDNVATGSGRPGEDLTFDPRNRYGAILWNHTFTPTLLNEFRVNGTREFVDQYSTNKNDYWGIPELQIEQIPNNRIQWGPSQGTNSPFQASQNQFEFRDNLSWNKGRHSFKMGGDYTINQDNNNYDFGAQRPIFVYHELWNFFNGAPIFEGITANPTNGLPLVNHTYFRQHDWALFFQDDWKVTPRLTLNLGIRYEYFEPLNEKYGHMSNVYLGTGADGLTDASVHTTDSLYPSDRNNFAPRIGFAWQPFADGNTVIRGGMGVSYDRTTDTVSGIVRQNPPFENTYGICCGTEAAGFGTPYVGGLIDPNIVGTNYTSMYNYGASPALAAGYNPTTGFPNAGTVQIYGVPQNFRTPYIYNYSLDIQHELPWKMYMDLGFSGSESRKLTRINNLDYFYLNGNPNVNPVYFLSSSASGNYNALLASLNRRYSNGLQFMANYRWSKSMDTLSNDGTGFNHNQFWPTNQTWDYGPSDYDATQNLLFTAMWDIPFMKGRHDLLGGMLGGWHIDGTTQYHSGFPWSPLQTNDCPTIPGIGGQPCPTLVTAQYMAGASDYSNDTFLHGGLFPNALVQVTCGTSTYTINQYFQPSTCNGNSIAQMPTGPPFIHRNSFRGPNYQTIDVALGKTFRFPMWGSEMAQLDLRANGYNIFNRLNFAPYGYDSPSTAINSATFGQPFEALAGRIIDLQIHLTF